MKIAPRRFISILFLSSLILFFFDQKGFFDDIFQGLQSYVVKPVTSVGQKTFSETTYFFESLLSLRFFLSDYEKIREERDFYRGEYLKVKEVEKENSFLRQALDLEGGGESQYILAQVVSFNPLEPSDNFTINKGYKDGVEESQAIIISGRILVGKVEKVKEKTSRVSLITSEKNRLTVTLESSSVNAIITGSPSGALRLELVKKEAELHEGELILTSGLEGGIPGGLLIGKVSRIISEESASFKEAVVRPFFEFKDLKQLFIVK